MSFFKSEEPKVKRAPTPEEIEFHTKVFLKMLSKYNIDSVGLAFACTNDTVMTFTIGTREDNKIQKTGILVAACTNLMIKANHSWEEGAVYTKVSDTTRKGNN